MPPASEALYRQEVEELAALMRIDDDWLALRKALAGRGF
jgi:hypothetical protein